MSFNRAKNWSSEHPFPPRGGFPCFISWAVLMLGKVGLRNSGSEYIWRTEAPSFSRNEKGSPDCPPDASCGLEMRCLGRSCKRTRLKKHATIRIVADQVVEPGCVYAYPVFHASSHTRASRDVDGLTWNFRSYDGAFSKLQQALGNSKVGFAGHPRFSQQG